MRRYLFALLLMLAFPVWATEVRELTWSEMIPADAPPQEIQSAPIHEQLQSLDTQTAESAPAAVQQSAAAPVVPALDGQRVKLPGYIVPLDMADDGKVTEFLLVPYFGACIHSPPPPANQIIHAVSTKPLKGMRSMDAIWVHGTLSLQRADTPWGKAGYRLAVDKIAPYEEAKKK